MDKRIYLDYAATTPINVDVYKEMLDCFQNVSPPTPPCL